MFQTTKQRGNLAEKVAMTFLKKRGYVVISRNYQFRGGEIDIISFDLKRQEIAFQEVRSRWLSTEEDFYNPLFTTPEDSVNSVKLRKIEKTAWRFLEKESSVWEPYFRDIAPYAFPDWRIDLLSVTVIKSVRKIKIKHYKYVTI